MKARTEVDVVLVGLGWTGGILAKELSEAGLSVVALERGGTLSTAQDFTVPGIRDELRYGRRHELMQNPARSTVTVRNKPGQTALPMRALGSFLPGEGVGGSGAHWGGFTWRWTDNEFKVRSRYEERYGKAFVPADVTLQDWGIGYDELEPYYDKFEYAAGVSGQAGNVKGRLIAGGNPFESPRQRSYPLPPLHGTVSGDLFTEASRALGYHPFPIPVAIASHAYTNPDGTRFGECQYCGFCGGYGCETNAKGSPHHTVIPIALKQPSFELRTRAWVTRVVQDAQRKRATGVEYVDLHTSESHFQPAQIVVLSAYSLGNVHLMLVSGIGKPYDPATNTGVVGKHYCYQMGTGTTLFFEGKTFNPFMYSASAPVLDDFHANWAFDRGPIGAVGGSIIMAGSFSGLPIAARALPAGTPAWGTEWKAATAKWYSSNLTLLAHSSGMPHRANHLDLDPSYRNALGQPLLRMTYDFQDNERKLSDHAARIIDGIARQMNPTHASPARGPKSWSVVPYQSTHNMGGTIMGSSPADSVVNKYGQSWDLPNLFITGGSLFVHNAAYAPTGLIGALAYLTADAIRTRYVKHPGSLL